MGKGKQTTSLPVTMGYRENHNKENRSPIKRKDAKASSSLANVVSNDALTNVGHDALTKVRPKTPARVTPLSIPSSDNSLGIPEELSPKSVLKRQENDLVKSNSGHRSSPITSANIGEKEAGGFYGAKTPKGAKSIPKSPAKIKIASSKTPRSLIKVSTKTPRAVKKPLWSKFKAKKAKLGNTVSRAKVNAVSKVTKSMKKVSGKLGKKSSREGGLLAVPVLFKAVKSPKNDLANVAGVKKILATPKPVKSPKNELTDVTGVAELVHTPEPIVVSRAAVTFDATPEQPSTSKAGKGVEEAVALSSAKETKVDNEATTSVSWSSSVGGRSTANPSKMSRGGAGSPKMEIPRFSLDEAEKPSAETVDEGTVEPTEVSSVERIVEEEPVPVKPIEEEDPVAEVSARSQRGAAKVVKPAPIKKATRGKTGPKKSEEEIPQTYRSMRGAKPAQIKSKKVSKNVELEPVEEAVPIVELSEKEEVPQTRRSKRGVKTAPVQEIEVMEEPVVLEAPRRSKRGTETAAAPALKVTATPVKRRRAKADIANRGKTAKVVKVEEPEVSPKKSSPVKTVRGRRAAAKRRSERLQGSSIGDKETISNLRQDNENLRLDNDRLKEQVKEGEDTLEELGQQVQTMWTRFKNSGEFN
eukprot:GFUD01027906.1.p1 GENE.GFUD01027906.1~~GFUD01027906.1.p1  ORF type:complete len:641 (+),score=192.11 GFUD01027906.1:45-1967(+)